MSFGFHTMKAFEPKMTLLVHKSYWKRIYLKEIYKPECKQEEYN